MLNYNPTLKPIRVDRFRVSSGGLFEPPKELDYRKLGMVSAVKDQGRVCGSCWAFTTAAQYESLFLKYTKTEYDFSEQHVLQCTLRGNCDGGFPNDALKILTRTGLRLEQEYPYKENHTYYE